VSRSTNAKKVARLVAAIENGGSALSAVVEKLQTLEARQHEIERERYCG